LHRSALLSSRLLSLLFLADILEAFEYNNKRLRPLVSSCARPSSYLDTVSKAGESSSKTDHFDPMQIINDWQILLAYSWPSLHDRFPYRSRPFELGDHVVIHSLGGQTHLNGTVGQLVDSTHLF
jgi:hypothetical protein